MMRPASSFAVTVDVTNPGQFFACCGLLEVAHGLWPGTEGWFDGSDFKIAVPAEYEGATLGYLLGKLAQCEISGLSEQERKELRTLDAERKRVRRLAPGKEERRRELGVQARAGAVRLGEPLSLLLNWWRTDDEMTPKTWAGLQELHKIARAAQDAISMIAEPTSMFSHSRVLRMPREYCSGKADHAKPVEPFYFDARRFAHALDAGFSLDVQNAESIAHPAVELLCLIGLQRFRPTAGPVRWSFDYWIWSYPLTALVAAPVMCGVVSNHDRKGYRFRLRFRDDQKRYKAFGFATPIGDQK